VWWRSAAAAGALAARTASATLFLNAEADLRAGYGSGAGGDAEFHALGVSARKVFADGRGDRLILFAQAEAVHTFEKILLHQAYAEYKGPMGRWNLAAGRVPLPWGLQTSWSPDRMLFTSPYTGIRAPFSDNGILWRGVVGDWDYGLSLTQGYGMERIEAFPGPGNLTGRVGHTFGLEGNLVAGLSFATGTATVGEEGHGMGDVAAERREAFALDLTWYEGRGVYRIEGGVRQAHEHWLATLFGTADYALLPRLTLQGAAHGYESHHGGSVLRVYGGVAIPWKRFTLRGGYEYEKADVGSHRVVVQLHGLLSVVR